MLGSNPSADPRTQTEAGYHLMVPRFVFALPKTSGWYQSDKSINEKVPLLPYFFISFGTEPGPVFQSID